MRSTQSAASTTRCSTQRSVQRSMQRSMQCAARGIRSMRRRAAWQANEEDDVGATPLMFAAKGGHVEAAELLMNHGSVLMQSESERGGDGNSDCDGDGDSNGKNYGCSYSYS